ncbi:MliC family protein [Rheinheimera sp. MMS21-TC3]|uniref:MliC family protein n=1 Tax=Rheinheimera sp. MMS21-TC3 TaxID=3072790 RepID=UPI0028C427EB|nr:MliC family protein [Rheinheimera sp. MMS21-TC3]WNO59410.1 MliC family protein [Rheinheimera sp. MMS21-TC3]WNO62248.1 MliC family protein [Rheinheimera sp. MMS21-TC3]
MRIIASLLLVFTIVVSGCSDPVQEDSNKQITEATPSATYNYLCESGASIIATYTTTDLALIQYKGNNYNMQLAVSASGSRYAGGGFEWWSKGSGTGAEAMLFKHNADDSTGEIIETCAEL